MNQEEIRKWMELASTFLGALGFIILVIGIMLIYGGFKLWKNIP